MDAGKGTINNIINGNRKLIVPFFQRSYVWSQEQWKRFIDDMEYISETGNEYFLGSIILKSKQTSSSSKIGDVRIIIDGQQRLTTMAIFLKVLGLKSDNNEIIDDLFTLRDDSLAISHSKTDTEEFEKVMSLKALIDLDSQKSNIIKAYNFFKDHSDESRLNIYTILNKAQFVSIDLFENEDEQQIFDTINSLGVKLTTGELLKNYFFDQDDICDYRTLWEPVFELDDNCREYWDQDVTSGRLKKSNIETFLYAFLQISCQSYSTRVRAEDKAMYRRQDTLFSNYKHFIHNYITGSQNDEEINREKILFFVNVLIDYAKIYRASFSPDILGMELSSDPGLDRLNVIIYGLEGTTLIPYIMFVEKNVSDCLEKIRIYELLESYLMRRIICKTSNNSYSDLFTENLIGNNVKTYLGLKKYLESKSDSSLEMPSDSEVFKAFQEFSYPNKRALGILYMLESKIRKGKMYSTSLMGFSSYSLEHLMPKNWISHWPSPKDKEERDLKIRILGNLAMISSSLNSSIRDSNWQLKLNGTATKGGLKNYSSGLETMADVLNCSQWDETEITNRSSWLYRRAVEVWNTSQMERNDLFTQSTKCVQEESPVVVQRRKVHHDQTKFILDGSIPLNKGAFVRAVIRKYIAEHPLVTFADLKNVFPDSMMGGGKLKGLLISRHDWLAWENKDKTKRYYVSDRESTLKSSDGIEFYVNTQWTLKSVENIVDVARKEGYDVIYVS